MKFTKLGQVAAVAAAGALFLTSCNGGGETDPTDSPAETDATNTSTTETTTEAGSDLAGTLNGAGASSMGSAQETWIAEFQTANPDVTINYEGSGSGAGRERFLSGGSDFAGSDSVLKEEEQATVPATCADGAYPIDLPVYVSPIAVVFNLDGIDELNLDAETIAKIFKGEITQWNDEAITSQNEGVDLPDQQITMVHRSDDSGTTKNFAAYLNDNVPEIWDAKPEDKFPYEAGEGAQGTSGVIDAVKNGNGTIGYADASRAGDLGKVSVKVGDEYVAYSAEAAAAVVDKATLMEGRPEGDLAFKIDRATTEKGVYPVVLVSYAIVCSQYADAEKGELVKAYIEYIVSAEGQAAAAEKAGSAPLSENIRGQIMESLEGLAG